MNHLARLLVPWRIAAALVVGLAVFGPVTSTFAQEAATAEATAEATPAEAEAAEEETPLTTDILAYAFDNAMLFLAAVLVLFMQAGFALVEVGLNASKNSVNILFKNVMDLAVGGLLFFAIGFGMMYPKSYMSEEQGATISKYFAFGGTGIYGEPKGNTSGLSPQTDWFFQAVFAATAATIVSGAVAGRMKFTAYLAYSAILTGLIYPVSGYWKWGGGWLADMGFQDFAGSAVVHAVGGFAGLAGAIVLGPRLGRFVDRKSIPMPGHNLVYATLGVFVLWVGWYGFNPGSQLAFKTADDINAVVLIAVNTTLAACAGTVVATILSWVLFAKPDLSMGLNGALGGLVGITAGCDCFSNGWSIVVGAIAGAVVVAGILLLDKFRIDDPVGAFPVHGLCGVWGCMAIGLLPNTHLGTDTSFMVQLIGTASICAWSFCTMLPLFFVLNAMRALRVSSEHEMHGLDISEHGMRAYGADTSPSTPAMAS